MSDHEEGVEVARGEVGDIGVVKGKERPAHAEDEVTDSSAGTVAGSVGGIITSMPIPMEIDGDGPDSAAVMDTAEGMCVRLPQIP